MLKIDGTPLKEIRKTLRYKKYDMCNYLGISVNAMTNWENGTSVPRKKKIPMILAYLDEQGYTGEGELTL